MRKSLLALILVGSFLVVAATVVLAGNPAADSIPDVGDVDVLASDSAGNHPPGAVPPQAAADGLATAEAAGPSASADDIPAGDNAPTAVPPPAAADGLATAEAAGPATEPPTTPAATTTTPTGDPTSGGTVVPPSDIVMVFVDSGHGQENVNLSVP